MTKQLLSLVLICVAFASNSQLYTQGSGVTDIDGNTYQTVIINGREYMAENLRVSKFNNGDAITQNTIPFSSYQDSIAKWYSHENNFQNDLIYGKLYSPNVYKNNRNVCPVNWHVSSDYEWNKTIFFIAQKFQKLNDLDSVLIRSLSVNWGGLNESGLNLTKGNTIYIPGVYDTIGNLITAGYYSFSDTLLSQYGYKTSNDPILGSHEELFSWGALPLSAYDYANIRCIRDLNTSNNIAVTAGLGVTDSDGNTYGSAIFGNGQEWMTSNLKTKIFNDGDLMPIQYTNEFPLEGIPATYSYLFNPNNDNTYGRLYSFRMIEYYADKVCPTGWKVPAMYEWNNLIDYLGGELKAAKKLKSTTGWGDVYIANDHNLLNNSILCDSLVSLDGTNESTMSVKPFGILGDSDDWFGEGVQIKFLSATYDSSIGNDETVGAFSMHIGQGVSQYGICNASYDIISDPSGAPIDTIFNYLGGDAIFNRDANFAVNAAFSNLEAGYIRCMRQSNGVGVVQTIVTQPTFTVFPNPAKDILNVELNGINPSFYVVFDAFGRALLKDKLQQKLTPISIENLDSGCYFIQVEGQSQITRFIKN